MAVLFSTNQVKACVAASLSRSSSRPLCPNQLLTVFNDLDSMAWASPVFNLVPCYSTSSGDGGVDSSDALVRDAGAAFDYAVSTNDVGSCGEEPPARVSSRACRRFRRSGYCKYGNSCFYNHVSADEFVEEALNNFHTRDVQTEDEVMDDTVIIADAVEATPLSAENSERNANDHYSTDFLPYVEAEEAAIECMSTTDVEYFRDWLDYSFAAWRRYTMQVTNTHTHRRYSSHRSRLCQCAFAYHNPTRSILLVKRMS